ncbi:hypothetical protein C8R42DRAFT_727739 [Lentinula raphanica]|nr:hypothetical protein C8R42DRAFT_727739 [Lentinula raphanica]
MRSTVHWPSSNEVIQAPPGGGPDPSSTTTPLALTQGVIIDRLRYRVSPPGQGPQLDFTNDLLYHPTRDPNNGRLDAQSLSLPATNWPVPVLVILCLGLPYIIRIRETSPRSGITVYNVFDQLYRALREPIDRDQLLSDPHSEITRAVNIAWNERYNEMMRNGDAVEASNITRNGPAKIDYLRGCRIFAGLEDIGYDDHYVAHTVRLHVRRGS